MALSPYADFCLGHLLAAFPQFKKFVVEQADGSMVIQFTSPSGFPFMISTERHEVTVYFDLHHSHFGCWILGEPEPGQSEAEEDVERAIKFIKALICGEILIAVWRRKGKFVMSSTIQRGENPSPKSWLGRWWLKGNTVELKAW